MKRFVIALLAFAFAGLAQAEPVRVSIEWIELDCSKCPQLATSVSNASENPEDDAAKLADLEKRATKRVLVRDVELIEPGTKIEHSTRIEAVSLDLDLTLALQVKGKYEIKLSIEMKHGVELDPTPKPGVQLTAAQMKGVQCQSIVSKFNMSCGHRVALRLLDEEPAHANGSVTELLAKAIGVKDNNGPKVRFLVINLEAADVANKDSQKGAAD